MILCWGELCVLYIVFAISYLLIRIILNPIVLWFPPIFVYVLLCSLIVKSCLQLMMAPIFVTISVVFGVLDSS